MMMESIPSCVYFVTIRHVTVEPLVTSSEVEFEMFFSVDAMNDFITKLMHGRTNYYLPQISIEKYNLVTTPMSKKELEEVQYSLKHRIAELESNLDEAKSFAESINEEILNV